MTAEQLFEQKLVNLERCTRHRCQRWRRPADVEDALQLARLNLWQQCIRAATPEGPPRFQINCRLLAVAACVELIKARRREESVTLFSDFDEGPFLTAPPTRATIVADGVTLTLSDAELDYPTECQTWRTGISGAEYARRIGLTTTAVNMRPHAHGGVGLRVGKVTEWKYPAR